MKYRWGQYYGLDRFDLSGPRGFPVGSVGWISRCAANPDSTSTAMVTRDLFTGYITSMRTMDSMGSTYHWKIWWTTWDEHHRPSSHNDQVRYQTRKEAMKALEDRFGVPSDEVHEVRWEGNVSDYMKESP